MKKFLFMAAAVAAAVGCNTTKSSTADYAADVPPPLVEGDQPPPGMKKTSALPMPAPKSGVAPEEITDGNVLDQARRLESSMRDEKKAVAGR